MGKIGVSLLVTIIAISAVPHAKAQADLLPLLAICNQPQTMQCLDLVVLYGLILREREFGTKFLKAFFLGENVAEVLSGDNIQKACRIAHVDLKLRPLLACLRTAWTSCNETILTKFDLTWSNVTSASDRLYGACDEECGDKVELKSRLTYCENRYKERDYPDIISTMYALKQCNIGECRVISETYNCSQEITNRCPELYNGFPTELEDQVDSAKCKCASLPYVHYCDHARKQLRIYCEGYVGSGMRAVPRLGYLLLSIAVIFTLG